MVCAMRASAVFRVLVVPCLLVGLPAAQADDLRRPEAEPVSQQTEKGAAAAGAEVSNPPARGPGHGRGMGRGFRGGRGPGGPGMRSDMMTIHAMFDDRDAIRRTVTMLPDGAVSLTESDDEAIAARIKDHVPNMESRVLENQPLPPMTFHPVFQALIKHADAYSLDYEETEKGVKATYQSDDPYVVMLVQEHAKLVSRFIANGHDEIHADYELPEFDESQAAAKAKALAAKAALVKRLSGRLKDVMQAEGPAAAIEVCSVEASDIAAAVGEDEGLRIGRTSLKLRNPGNTAPEWVKPLLKGDAKVAQFTSLDEHTLGGLLPIRLQAACVTCHGPAASLSDDVREQLSTHYPDDAATGYQAGDLRGWFWVEVPLQPSKE